MSDPGAPALAPLSELYTELAPRVRRLACRRVGAADAEDVVQEVFLRAHRAYDRYVEDGKSWPWIRLITERVCIDLHRRGHSHLVSTGEDEYIAAVQTTEEDETFVVVAAHEQRATVKSVLAKLSPRQQRVLVLREVGGWSAKEIAAEHGMTIEGVKATLKRARVAFRNSYAEVAQGGAGLGSVGGFAGFRPARAMLRVLRRHLRRVTMADRSAPLQGMLASAAVTVAAVAAVALAIVYGAGVLVPGPAAASDVRLPATMASIGTATGAGGVAGRNSSDVTRSHADGADGTSGPAAADAKDVSPGGASFAAGRAGGDTAADTGTPPNGPSKPHNALDMLPFRPPAHINDPGGPCRDSVGAGGPRSVCLPVHLDADADSIGASVPVESPDWPSFDPVVEAAAPATDAYYDAVRTINQQRDPTWGTDDSPGSTNSTNSAGSSDSTSSTSSSPDTTTATPLAPAVPAATVG